MSVRCEHCRDPLASVGGPKVGRPQKYCSTACRQAAHRQRQQKPPAQALRTEGTSNAPPVPELSRPTSSMVTDDDIQELIKDIQEAVRQLLRALPQCDAEEPLLRIARLQAQVDGLTAGLVGRARHHRLTWGRVGRALNISEDTARHRYTDAHIQRQLARFTRPHSAPLPSYTPSTEASRSEEPASDDPSTPREPSGAAFNRLAPVLSMLARASQLPLKDLSRRTNCSASYLSRVLNGERTPTWLFTERFARACGADPSVLRKVWESERLREKRPLSPPEDPSLPAGTRLLKALNTLHIRAGRPTSYDIAVASRWHLKVEEVAPVLEGTQIPSRSLLTQLLHVLGGDPSHFVPLWESASAEHRHLPRHLHTHEPPKAPKPVARLNDVPTKFSETLTQDHDSLKQSQRATLLGGPVIALVREWHDDEGWGVLDSPETPGGCWAWYPSIKVKGFRNHALAPGQRVSLKWEAPGIKQHGYHYRAVHIVPLPADHDRPR